MTADDQNASRRAAGVRRAGGLAALRPPTGGWIAIGSVVLLFLGHYFYGGLVSDVSLLLELAASLLLAGALIDPRLRDSLLRLKGLTVPAVLFALTILVALWTLTPWTPGGPHPVWTFVGVRPGASTIDKSATIIEIVKLLGLACVFLVGCAVGRHDERARYALWITLALGSVYALWAFIGGATGQIYQTQGHRLEAHFHNPNTAGTFFAVLLVLGIAELTRKFRSNGRRRSLSGILLFAAPVLIFAVCLLATASRGAMMAFLGASALLTVYRLFTGQLRPTRAILGVLAGAVVLLGGVALLGETLIDRLFQSHESAIVRSSIWSLHWRAFLDSPLFGYGLGSAETVNSTLISASNVSILINIKAILNLYLQWLEEAGIVGAAPMFLCVALIIFSTARRGATRSRMTGLIAALLSTDAVFLIHGATDFALELYSMAIFWSWLLGLQFALAQGEFASMNRAVRLSAVIGLAAATAAGSILVLAALNSGGRAGPLQMAAGYDRAATQTLVAEPIPSPLHRGLIGAASQAAITQYPYDTRAWLRLSFIDTLRNRGLTPQGVAYLQSSYDLIAVDPDWGIYRIVFALENSQRLPPSLRTDVRNEAYALAATAKLRGQLRQMLPTIQNPAGRLSLALWLSRPTTVAK